MNDSDKVEKGEGEVKLEDEGDYFPSNVVTKYDADSQSAVTYLTDATSVLLEQNPSSATYASSSKLEI